MEPGDVQRWFSADVAADALASYVAALRSDPQWRVLSLPGPHVWTLNLLYWPTGERLEVVLERVGLEWRLRR